MEKDFTIMQQGMDKLNPELKDKMKILETKALKGKHFYNLVISKGFFEITTLHETSNYLNNMIHYIANTLYWKYVISNWDDDDLHLSEGLYLTLANDAKKMNDCVSSDTYALLIAYLIRNKLLLEKGTKYIKFNMEIGIDMTEEEQHILITCKDVIFNEWIELINIK